VANRHKPTLIGDEKMKLTTNKQGKPFWIDANLTDEFSADLFHKVPHSKLAIELAEELNREPDNQLAFHSNLGSITILDRMTGFSFGRDTETGYRAPDGKFWLASGMFDIRSKNVRTIGEAIDIIKDSANNCIGE
jgi:hypothetical protein